MQKKREIKKKRWLFCCWILRKNFQFWKETRIGSSPKVKNPKRTIARQRTSPNHYFVSITHTPFIFAEPWVSLMIPQNVVVTWAVVPHLSASRRLEEPAHVDWFRYNEKRPLKRVCGRGISRRLSSLKCRQVCVHDFLINCERSSLRGETKFP